MTKMEDDLSRVVKFSIMKKMKARIIKIADGKVYLSKENDDENFFTIEKSSFDFEPKTGDSVEVFTSENGETLVVPKQKSSVVLAESVETPFMKNDEISGKSRAAAAILCFFFGFLGVHNFYLGNVGQGLLTLALWVVPVLSAIFAVVNPFFAILGALCHLGIFVFIVMDFILILCGIKRDGNGDRVLHWG